MTPEIYRRVTEARPELAMPELEWDADDPPTCEPSTPMWVYKNLGPFDAGAAHTLILAHWLANLGEGFALMRSHTGKKFIVVHCLHLAYRTVGEYHDDPCIALAEHFVPGSTKGAG